MKVEVVVVLDDDAMAPTVVVLGFGGWREAETAARALMRGENVWKVEVREGTRARMRVVPGKCN